MPARNLKDTTMDPKKRSLQRVKLPPKDERENYKATVDLVESLMGRKPELRFEFIQKNAKFARDLDV
jgi:topoisomerase-4 subunit B